ncbi:MAG: hypothetical protein QME68_01975 [Elusimicrobiota bacterium]|nr:hypothetical protein [Elusimicrobiota bacterium]
MHIKTVKIIEILTSDYPVRFKNCLSLSLGRPKEVIYYVEMEFNQESFDSPKWSD